MRSRTKTISFYVISMIVTYAIFASIESAKLSSKTVDEAFEKFKNEFVQTEMGDKEFYRIGNSTFVPFEVGNSVSLVRFEKGIFGWKQTYYSHDEDRGSSYTSIVDGDILLHGIIPKDIVAETETLKVNGIEADIVRLNDKTSVWIFMNNKPKNFSNRNIDFLDKDGQIISEI
ncbi:hypothetical protein AC622_06395 [Bacillus sp. FJAT-27916]|uniref:hypothetical protein n=2 Tax=Bacillaceae TaxID=186817 RepID=UPI0006717B6A|nr:hypothetical protein [Bacillus sp. FJAT-27916]KMY43926.1 hypothetical protein AC622_06395 [Bacillus sp. FJAT-27916]